MKRYLAFQALAVMSVMFLAATPSFVRLPTPILVPSGLTNASTNVLNGWQTSNISTDTASVAVIFKVPGRGFTPDTITMFGMYARVGLAFGGTDSIIVCSLYNVSGGAPEVASGVPAKLYQPTAGDGGPHGTSGQIPSVGSKTYYFQFSSTPVCTAGQTIAAVFKRNAGNGSTFTVSRLISSTNAIGCEFPLSMVKLAANTWTRTGGVPAFGIQWSDFATRGTYMDAGFPVDSMVYVYADSGSSPDEVGNRMLFSMPMKVIGAWAMVQFGAGPCKGKISLYDTTGTNGTLIASAMMNDTITAPAGAQLGNFYVYFQTEVTMNPNQTYRLVYTPAESSNVNVLRYAYLDSTSKLYGSRITETRRTDGGAWTDMPKSVIPHMGLIVSQLSAGLESGSPGRLWRMRFTDSDTTVRYSLVEKRR